MFLPVVIFLISFAFATDPHCDVDKVGQCCYKILEGMGSTYCKQADGDDCTLYGDYYTPGLCDVSPHEYKIACVCRYDMVRWLKVDNCKNCDGDCHLSELTSDMCTDITKIETEPPVVEESVTEETYCYRIEASDIWKTNQYCRQADGDDCDIFDYYYDNKGTCQENTPFDIGCININDQFGIVFWVSIADCSTCEDNTNWKFADSASEQLCSNYQQELAAKQHIIVDHDVNTKQAEPKSRLIHHIEAEISEE